ncbi:MAG TPA: tetratricopeptide repeat protein [Planktothrix sp.]|jgi:tetratricopeptide (TPR) repeat protein
MWVLVALAISYVGSLTNHHAEATWAVAIIFFAVLARKRAGYSALRDARIAYNAEQFGKAAELSEKAMRQNPNLPDAYAWAATSYLAVKQPQKAIEVCDRALTLKKKNPHVYHCRAEASIKLGNLDSAIADATTALNLKKNLYGAYVTLGTAYILKRQYAKALDEAATAIARFGAFDSVVALKASALTSMNRLDEALDDCNQCLTLSTKKRDLPRLYVLRAAVYARKREIEKALEDCDKALEMDSQFFIALICRVYFYWLSKQYDKAEVQLQALAAKPLQGKQRASMLTNRARVRAALGQTHEALDDANEALTSQPTAPPLLVSRGYVFWCARKYQAALDDLSKAIELDPYCAEAFWFRHRVYESMGEIIKAAADKKVALDFDYKE